MVTETSSELVQPRQLTHIAATHALCLILLTPKDDGIAYHPSFRLTQPPQKNIHLVRIEFELAANEQDKVTSIIYEQRGIA